MEKGMTLIEVLTAMAVLAVGMLGSMLLILTGMQTNSRNRNDTTAAVLDQEIIEKFTALKQYPKGTYAVIYDCSTGSGNSFQAAVTQAAAPAGAGATLYTSSTAPSPDKIGYINWTQSAPTLATSTTPGYAIRYRTCTRDLYEVRWNVMAINSRISILTVSSRQVAAQAAQTAGATNQAVLYAPPTTLRTLIEN